MKTGKPEASEPTSNVLPGKLSEPAGRLIMAANGLGRAGDIPTRSLEALRTADLIVFEEDRPARAALKAAGVHRSYLKLNEHGQVETLDQVRQALSAGLTVVYMSDQGTPNLADPGADLTAIAYNLNARVETVPGPSSLTAALAAWPYPVKSFTFAGFLPRDPTLRADTLKRTAHNSSLIGVLDTPYRLGALLETCTEIFPTKREALLALDIGGEHEAFWFGPIGQLRDRARTLADKLNFVLLIAGDIKPLNSPSKIPPKERAARAR